jgi:hypothetical protein
VFARGSDADLIWKCVGGELADNYPERVDVRLLSVSAGEERGRDPRKRNQKREMGGDTVDEPSTRGLCTT